LPGGRVVGNPGGTLFGADGGDDGFSIVADGGDDPLSTVTVTWAHFSLPTRSTAQTSKVYEPAVAEVPDSTPFICMNIPRGFEPNPNCPVKEYGGVPPLAVAIVRLHGCFTCGHTPSIVVIAGGLATMEILRSKLTDCGGCDEADLSTVKESA